jgi:hypothetical protein
VAEHDAADQEHLRKIAQGKLVAYYSLRVFSPASLVERERPVEEVESPTSMQRFSNIMT